MQAEYGPTKNIGGDGWVEKLKREFSGARFLKLFFRGLGGDKIDDWRIGKMACICLKI